MKIPEVQCLTVVSLLQAGESHAPPDDDAIVSCIDFLNTAIRYSPTAESIVAKEDS